jgi:hypothetical protein
MEIAIQGIPIIDVDTHYNESHDLWTSRAPGEERERHRLVGRGARCRTVPGAPGVTPVQRLSRLAGFTRH